MLRFTENIQGNVPQANIKGNTFKGYPTLKLKQVPVRDVVELSQKIKAPKKLMLGLGILGSMISSGVVKNKSKFTNDLVAIIKEFGEKSEANLKEKNLANLEIITNYKNKFETLIKEKNPLQEKLNNIREMVEKPVTKPKMEANSHNVPKLETKPEVKAVSHNTPKAETKPEVKVTSHNAPKAETKPEVKAASHNAPKVEAKPEVKVTSHNAPKAETKPEVKVNSHNAPKAETKPEVKVNSHNAPKAETKPEVKVNSHNAPKVEAKPEVKVTSHNTPKVEAKPDVKTVSHNEPKVQNQKEGKASPYNIPELETNTEAKAVTQEMPASQLNKNTYSVQKSNILKDTKSENNKTNKNIKTEYTQKNNLASQKITSMLENESLRKSLDVSANYKIQYMHGTPFIINQKGNYLVLDTTKNAWHEYTPKDWQKFIKNDNKEFSTKGKKTLTSVTFNNNKKSEFITIYHAK